MGGSRRRLKRGKAPVRVGQRRPEKRQRPQPLVLPGVSIALGAEWNEKVSLRANYRALGLAADPNHRGGRNADGRAAEARAEPAEGTADCVLPSREEGGGSSDDEPDEVRAALGKKRKHGPLQPLQRLTKMQRVYVGNLIQKYGDDVMAMTRDMKLNAMQHSPGVLKLLCQRFWAYDKISRGTST